MHKPTRFVAIGVAAATTVATVATMSANAAVGTDTSELRDAVTTAGVTKHLSELQAIADANGGTRASGTPGYEASADYVKGLLEGAGYNVTEQPFEYELFIETSDPILDPTSPDLPAYTVVDDFLTMEYSGSGDVTQAVTPVDVVIPPGASANTSTSGCEAADFAGFPAGNIALVQRGTCTFRIKVDNAAAAGAAGVIIFNEGQDGRQETLNGTLSQPQAAIPAVGTSFAVGEELYSLTQSGGVTVHLAVEAHVETKTTHNVIAETTGGRADRVVMAGGHLDSVLEGPGINDNGSGSAAILEIALQMADLDIQPTNKVRFAFWGAEESGLIGSQFYVDSLTKTERKNIMLYLNFDMVGSPNFVPFVYDGDGSAFGLKGPNGSSHIEATFADFLAANYDGSEPTAFDGRSDYDAFISVGIPAGGLFTGAEGVKSAEQAATYGGTAGLAYDPCYHQACDTIDNVNADALDQMSDAIAHAVLSYAMTTSSVNGTGQASSNATSNAEAEFQGHNRVR